MNYELIVTHNMGAPAIWQAVEAQPFMAISVGDVIDLKGAPPQRVREIHHSWYQSPTGSHVHRMNVLI